MLSARGTLFVSSCSSAPSCIPARASIFTGLSPSTHGRIGYKEWVSWRYRAMLPQLLLDNCYQTHCVGKTHFFSQRAHLGFETIDLYEGDQKFDGTYVSDYHRWLRERTNGLVEEPMHGVDWNSWYARPSHLPEGTTQQYVSRWK
jgi:arylsulfatase A-like enzyme